jgi:predicted transcriptional regulator
MIDVDDAELSDEDRAAIEAGLASLDRGEGVPHEEILCEFGLSK